MTEEEIKKEEEKINAMSQEDIARLWRFAPRGHPYFDAKKPFFKILIRRFMEVGGFTPEISKRIGWEKP